MLFSVIPSRIGVRVTAKPESSNFNAFWMPDQVRHDGFGTFYEAINILFILFLEYHIFLLSIKKELESYFALW